MLAKNEEELENKFSIRKLSIGATAVLLGFTFWTTGQTAKADTIAPDSQTKNSKNGG